MNFQDKNVIEWLGKNLEKGKKNYNKRLKELKDKFVRDYPYAKVSQFEFRVIIDEYGDVQENETGIFYHGDGKERLYDLNGTSWSGSWNIDSNVFKYKYADALMWGPSSGIFQPTTEEATVFTFNGKRVRLQHHTLFHLRNKR